MSLLEELLPASYKKAVFLISTASTKGGRKDQLHVFPNSNRQTIEDFGRRTRSYSITGFISSKNYKARRDRLIEALEDGEVGTLSHPFYGEIQNVKCRSFSINENTSELGRAEFSMEFDISNDIGSPIETENTLALLNKTNEDVQEAANEEIANNWEVESKFSGNFNNAQEKIGSLTTSYDENSDVVTKSIDKIDEFNSDISNFGNEVNSLIQKPQELADSITNLSSGMNDLYSTAEQQLIAWEGFFDFGEDDIASTNETAGLAQRNKNNNTINNSMQTQALSYSYLAASQSEYKTVEDLEEEEVRLEKQYSKILDSDATISTNLREQISAMRENASSFFNQQRITLNRIIEVTTPELPARVISFQYYNDSSNGEDIAKINNNANVSFLSGKIKVFTG